MGLEGNLRDFPLPEIIQLLGLQRKTGKLEISRNDEKGDIYFRKGKIIFSDLKSLRYTVDPLSDHEIKIANLIYLMLEWDNGNFRFLTGILPSEEGTPVDLDPDNLILEGLRRLEELQKIKEHIPSLDEVFQISLKVDETINRILSPAEWKVLAHLNGKRTIKMIAEKARIDEIETGKIIYEFCKLGIIEKV